MYQGYCNDYAFTQPVRKYERNLVPMPIEAKDSDADNPDDDLNPLSVQENRNDGVQARNRIFREHCLTL